MTSLIMYHALRGYYWRDRDLWPSQLITPPTKLANDEYPERMAASTMTQHYEVPSSVFTLGVATWKVRNHLYQVYWLDERVDHPQMVAEFK